MKSFGKKNLLLQEKADATKIFNYWQKTYDIFLTEVSEKSKDADLFTNHLTHKTYARS